MDLIDKNCLDEEIPKLWRETFPELGLFESCSCWKPQIILEVVESFVPNFFFKIDSFFSCTLQSLKIEIIAELNIWNQIIYAVFFSFIDFKCLLLYQCKNQKHGKLKDYAKQPLISVLWLYISIADCRHRCYDKVHGIDVDIEALCYDFLGS